MYRTFETIQNKGLMLGIYGSPFLLQIEVTATFYLIIQTFFLVVLRKKVRIKGYKLRILTFFSMQVS